MHFEFATATRIIFGAGEINKIGGLASEFGRIALVVIGKDASRVVGLLQLLHEDNLITTIYQVEGEPSVQDVKEGVELARRSNADLVIGFGGGSALDAAKAIAGLTTNRADIYEYLEVIGRGKPLENPPLAYIAVPTTAGTGSEVTRNAVLGSAEKQVKVSLRSPLLLPRLALVDPVLTYNLPPAVTASTGMDALTQVIEPYVSNLPNPVTDVICREGMRRAASSLARAYVDGQDKAARENMSLASLFGGLALANAKLGAVHGLAGVLGGMFHAPHGAVCARLLPEVMQENIQTLSTTSAESSGFKRFIEVARILTNDVDANAQDGVRWVRNLCRDLDIPGLSAYGVEEKFFQDIIEKSQKSSSMKGNPIALSNDQLGDVLLNALV